MRKHKRRRVVSSRRRGKPQLLRLLLKQAKHKLKRSSKDLSRQKQSLLKIDLLDPRESLQCRNSLSLKPKKQLSSLDRQLIFNNLSHKGKLHSLGILSLQRVNSLRKTLRCLQEPRLERFQSLKDTSSPQMLKCRRSLNTKFTESTRLMRERLRMISQLASRSLVKSMVFQHQHRNREGKQENKLLVV